MPFKSQLLIIIVLFIFSNQEVRSQTLATQIEKIINDNYPENEPGLSVLIAVKDSVIYRSAFGMANLELNVKMKPKMVFQVGSITKQFTAVCILKLVEQGKLSLEDDITKYIPDYPTQGHKITIHHLLTHISGIKNYTNMERWKPLCRNDYIPDVFIDIFKNEPMDFAPGEEYRYNNSAYFLLGRIIELVSRQTYKNYIESNIFKPLNMKSSFYGVLSQIVENRASGYQKKNGEINNAEYLSLTQPYAAGSILSTVDDLHIWNRAIHSNKLLKKETIELAFTNYSLNNGSYINYGYGWFLKSINDRPTIEHAGDIFGYSSNAIYLPNEDIFIVILSNCEWKRPVSLSNSIAKILLNKTNSNYSGSKIK